MLKFPTTAAEYESMADRLAKAGNLAGTIKHMENSIRCASLPSEKKRLEDKLTEIKIISST